MASPNKKRTKLLLELESIIGNECYNGNIQNWGPNGVFEGEGREFRYPITFIGDKGKKEKRWRPDTSMNPKTAMTGFYGFGANQLSIIRALDKVVAYLECTQGLEIDKKRKRADTD